MSGFDIEQQANQAKKEDEGTVVYIHGIDELPMYYQEEEGGEDIPVTIHVAGAHSQRYRRVEENLRKRKLKPGQMTGERIHNDNIDKVAACTLDWAGFSVNGNPVECTKDNARMLYKTCPWVLDQVLEAMHDHTRFFESGSKPRQSTSEQEHS